MANINDNDTFLVNRNNTSYQVETQNLMAKIQDTDLMLVNRGNTSYKVTGDELKDSLIADTPPTIGSIELIDNNTSSGRFTDESFTTNVTMTDDQRSTKALDYYVTGKLRTFTNFPIGTNNTTKLEEQRETLIDTSVRSTYSQMATPFAIQNTKNGSVWVFSTNVTYHHIVGIIDGYEESEE